MSTIYADLGLSRDSVRSSIDDLLRKGAPALERVLAELPRGFPSMVAEPIAKGFLARLGQLDDGHAVAQRREE